MFIATHTDAQPVVVLLQSPAKFHIRILRASNWNTFSHAFFVSLILFRGTETAGDPTKYTLLRSFIMRHVSNVLVCVLGVCKRQPVAAHTDTLWKQIDTIYPVAYCLWTVTINHRSCGAFILTVDGTQHTRNKVVFSATLVVVAVIFLNYESQRVWCFELINFGLLMPLFFLEFFVGKSLSIRQSIQAECISREGLQWSSKIHRFGRIGRI